MIRDHKGNEYESLAAMCAAYGVDVRVFKARHGRWGWTLEKILTDGRQAEPEPVAEQPAPEQPAAEAPKRRGRRRKAETAE